MMKQIVAAAICLAIGVGLGMWNSHREFAGDILPTKPVLEYLELQRSPGAIRSGPHLVMVGGETHNFGSLPLWAKRDHTFLVRNEGTETLRMVMGKPTCSCTAGSKGAEPLQEGDALEVPPGTEQPITLEWEIKTSMDEFSQSVSFTTNDPHRQSLVLAIVGRVEEAVRRDRETIVFSNVSASATVTEALRLDTKQTDKLAIADYRWLKPGSDGFFDVRIEPIPREEAVKKEPGISSVMVYVTLKPGLPLGALEQTLVLTTNMAPAVPPIHVPIRGTVVGDLSIYGPGVSASTRTVDLGVIPQGSGRQRKILVVVKGAHRDATQLSVASVEPAHLQVQLGPADLEKPNVRMYPLTIEVPADAPLVNLSGTEQGRTARIVLDTTHPTIKRLDIQVTYIVR